MKWNSQRSGSTEWLGDRKYANIMTFIHFYESSWRIVFHIQTTIWHFRDWMKKWKSSLKPNRCINWHSGQFTRSKAFTLLLKPTLPYFRRSHVYRLSAPNVFDAILALCPWYTSIDNRHNDTTTTFLFLTYPSWRFLTVNHVIPHLLIYVLLSPTLLSPILVSFVISCSDHCRRKPPVVFNCVGGYARP